MESSSLSEACPVSFAVFCQFMLGRREEQSPDVLRTFCLAIQRFHDKEEANEDDLARLKEARNRFRMYARRLGDRPVLPAELDQIVEQSLAEVKGLVNRIAPTASLVVQGLQLTPVPGGTSWRPVGEILPARGEQDRMALPPPSSLPSHVGLVAVAAQ